MKSTRLAAQGPVRPSLTVGLLNRPELKSVARTSPRPPLHRNDLEDFDGARRAAI
jgi:hypothetical protein